MRAHGWQTISEWGVVRSREPFKFCGAATITLVQPIVSSAVNFDLQSVCKLVTVVGHQFITLTVDICVEHGGREALRRTGLSAAAETCR